MKKPKTLQTLKWPASPPEPPYYFISDLHLDAAFRKNNPHYPRIDAFFDHLRQEAGALFILGDYFDFWFEYRHSIPKRALYGLHRLMQLREAAVPVVYLTGNHDGWISDFFPKELQIPVYRDPVILEYGSHRMLLLHGDGLRSGDRGYRWLKSFLHCPLNQWLYRRLHPDIGIPLACWFSALSRKHGLEWYEESTDLSLQAFYNHWFQQGIHVILMGHNHKPSSRLTDRGQIIILGDWIRHFSYARFDGENMRLLYWNEPQ